MNVQEIRLGGVDSTGAMIVAVYAKVDGLYAVYATDARVMVHFSDDQKIMVQQQACLATANPIRGEINGLIDGWRASTKHDQQAKTRLFDRRVADALVIGLNGQPDVAGSLLQAIKVDLLDERTAMARYEYLTVASLAAAAIVLICILATATFFPWGAAMSGELRQLWRAAAVGAVGAFFFIAIAIRNRSIATDLQSSDNRSDAILRISIGSIAGVVIVCLMNARLVQLVIGGNSIDFTGREGWLEVVIVAFVAGFLERLVPDLLDRSTLVSRPPAAAPVPPPVQPRGAAGGAAPGPQGGGAQGPRGGDPGPVDDGPEPDEPDGCVADVKIEEDDLTDDSELPETVGGVADERS